LDLAAAVGLTEAECRRCMADLASLERITSQFLLFAGQHRAEPALEVPLDALVAEVAAVAGAVPLELVLEPLVRRVRPTALTRALANLIDNALAYGAPPLRLELRGEGEVGFAITVWDHGAGIPALAWSRALEPFQRLDPARGDQGHCGLGLAIAERIGRDHGGGLESQKGPHGFGVTLRGRSVLES
jgi:two-component system osmolarity sensor histidine kinase EnvZ